MTMVDKMFVMCGALAIIGAVVIVTSILLCLAWCLMRSVLARRQYRRSNEVTFHGRVKPWRRSRHDGTHTPIT